MASGGEPIGRSDVAIPAAEFNFASPAASPRRNYPEAPDHYRTAVGTRGGGGIFKSRYVVILLRLASLDGENDARLRLCELIANCTRVTVSFARVNFEDFFLILHRESVYCPRFVPRARAQSIYPRYTGARDARR